MRTIAIGISIGQACLLLFCAPVSGGPIERAKTPWSLSSPYLGGGLAITHHTGKLCDSKLSVNSWQTTPKAFAGFWFSEAFSGELAYYRMGTSSNLKTGATEKSQVVAFAVMARQPLSDYPWFRSAPFKGLSWFVKAGPAYRRVEFKSPVAADVSGGGWTYIISGGFQHRFAKGWFVRAEYEYIGKQPKGSGIRVQHTPISLNIGFTF